MINRRRFLTISALAATAAVAGLPGSKVRWQGVAMGSDVSITLYGSDERAAAAALQAARNTITRMEKLFSIYDPDSEISRLNADQHRHVPAEFVDLVRIAGHANQMTGGLFDPTVQTIFAAKSKDGSLIARHLSPVGWRHVQTIGNHVAFRQKGMAITLNGIAQGFATDRVRDVLVGLGYRRTLVNIGEFRAGLQRARIGIGGANGRILANEEIQDEAIATSSAGGFTFADGSSHILNPLADGQPKWAGATVIAGNAAWADALSTALILSEGTELAGRLVGAGEAKVVLLEDFSGRLTRV
jgi:thiamine biosynthesis lipoprotein